VPTPIDVLALAPALVYDEKPTRRMKSPPRGISFRLTISIVFGSTVSRAQFWRGECHDATYIVRDLFSR
jgi:hypothetical protein